MKKFLLLVLTILAVYMCGLTKVDATIDSNEEVEKLLEERKYPQLIGILRRSGAQETLLSQLLYTIRGDYISVYSWNVAALKQNQEILVASGEDQHDHTMKQIESSPRRYTSVQILSDDVIGISEGIAYAEGRSVIHNNESKAVMEKVAQWKDIKEFDSWYPSSAVAVTNIGKILYANEDVKYENKVNQVANTLDSVIAVEDGSSYVVFLMVDGTVKTVSLNDYHTSEAETWTGIVDISLGRVLLGLKEDGTVMLSGDFENKMDAVKDWSDIIAISSGKTHAIGLKRDGTVVGVGSNLFHQLEVEHWTDIVAIDAYSYLTIGLKADGTLVMAGDCSASGVNTPEISMFRDLYVPVPKQ